MIARCGTQRPCPASPTHRSGQPSQRQLRVGELVRHALADVFARGEAGTGARRRARLGRRGAHVARPEARDRARRAARQPRRRTRWSTTLNRSAAHAARKDHAGAPPDALHARPEVPSRHALRGRQRASMRCCARPRSPATSAREADEDGTLMGRRDKGSKVDGWLVLDKPVGMTSTEAVARVKRLFDAAEGRPCRHARSARLRLPADRARRGDQDRRLRHGRAKALPLHRPLGRGDRPPTTPKARSPRPPTARPSEAEIRAILPEFTGDITQVPPRFSAVKIAGERAYDLARDGEDGRARAARDRRSTGSSWSRCPDRRSRRVPGRMRQGRLCAGAGARHGPAARHLRPCRGAAPAGGRPVRRGAT